MAREGAVQSTKPIRQEIVDEGFSCLLQCEPEPLASWHHLRCYSLRFRIPDVSRFLGHSEAVARMGLAEEGWCSAEGARPPTLGIVAGS